MCMWMCFSHQAPLWHLCLRANAKRSATSMSVSNGLLRSLWNLIWRLCSARANVRQKARQPLSLLRLCSVTSLRPPASSTNRSKHLIIASTSASLSRRFLPRPPRGSSCTTARVIVDFARRSSRAISEGTTPSSLYHSFARRSSSEDSGEPGMLRNGAPRDSPSQSYMQRKCQQHTSNANG